MDIFGEDRVTVFDRLDDALDHAMGKAEEGGRSVAGCWPPGR